MPVAKLQGNFFLKTKMCIGRNRKVDFFFKKKAYSTLGKLSNMIAIPVAMLITIFAFYLTTTGMADCRKQIKFLLLMGKPLIRP